MPGFIENYVAWATETTDAPPVYHTWGAYSALAAAVGRKILIRYGSINMAPNLYIAILGPSSVFRKSTALYLSRAIACCAGAYRLPDEGSVEGFLGSLRDHPEGVLYYSELASLLAQFSREYSSALQPLLTDLYDSPESYTRKLKNEEIQVDRPCVNILAASTLEWLLDKAKVTNFSGGFLARFCVVVARKKDRTIALPPPIDDSARNSLIQRLREIVDFACPKTKTVQVSPEPIRKEYEKWYASFERRASSPMLASFISRLAITALKLTVLEELSENASPRMTADAFARASSNIEGLADQIAQLENEDLSYGEGREARETQAVVAVLRSKGQVSKHALLCACHVPAPRLNPILRALADRDQITLSRVKTPGTPGRPLELVIWNNHNAQNAPG